MKKRKKYNNTFLELSISENGKKIYRIKKRNEDDLLKNFIRSAQKIWNYDFEDLKRWIKKK